MIGTELARAHAPAHLEAVHARHHHVEHDEVEGRLAEAVERLAAVGRLHDLVAVLAQREGEQRLDRLLVVDEQDAGRVLEHVLYGQGTPSYPADSHARPADLPRGTHPVLLRADRGRVLAQRPSPARSGPRSTPDAFSASRAAGRPRRAGPRAYPGAPRGRQRRRGAGRQAGRRLPRHGLLPGQHAVASRPRRPTASAA